MHARRMRIFVFALCCLLSGGTMAAVKIEWSDKYYNPQQTDEDVILPLPCGGAIAFRRIHVESTGPLSDVRVDLGASDDLWGYAENTLTQHIAGSFTGAKPSTRYFLIGKYEVSQLQYQAVMEEKCPQPSMKLRLPQNEVGWFDAVRFTDKLSQWLLAKAPDALPHEQNEPGFVRLPTEVEWEFVARGGTAVSIADFRERHFPMPEGIERYVWFSGTRSANGKLQLTGLLSPNPLGVHDILGNVDEIVWDAFRLNRLDRLHGQAGGFIVRGGNYFTADQDIRSSQREEVPHFDKNGPRRSKTTGFRVAVSLPVILSSANLKSIQEAWTNLGNEKGSAKDSATTPSLTEKIEEDPVQELAVLSNAATDKNMKNRLQRLGSIMRATLDARNRQRDNAARASLRMGGVICQQVGEDGKLVNDLRRRNERFCAGTPGGESVYSKEECDKRKEFLDTAEARYLINIGVYADSIIEVARNYDGQLLTDQSKLLLTELAGSEGGVRLSEFIKVYKAQAVKYVENWLVKRDSWSEECRLAFEAK